MPKIGFVEIKMERQLPDGAVIKNATVRKTRTNKYFVSIMFELEKEIKQVEPDSYIGLDFAMADFHELKRDLRAIKRIDGYICNW